MKLRNPITTTRLAIVSGLVFAETFLIPINQVLLTGVYPDGVQLLQACTTAGIQVTTIIGALLEREPSESTE